MNALALIKRLHEHRRWANARLREAASGLTADQLTQPFPIGQGSVWATLTHMYAAEHVWLEVLQGREDARLAETPSFDAWPQLNEAWLALEGRWEHSLDGLEPGSLDVPVERINSRGEHTAALRYDLLMHVCMHAHYTAAQAVNMLRRLDVAEQTLPDLQLITLSRQEANL